MLDHLSSYLAASVYLRVAVHEKAMETSNDPAELERILTNYCGPIAKFVIGTQLKGRKRFEDMNNDEKAAFFEEVTTKSVYDPELKKKVKKEIMDAYFKKN